MPRELVFDAEECSFLGDEGLALVCGVRGRDSFGAEHHLLFQRDREDGPDDWGVHLEVDDQGNSGYGAVETCRLTRSSLEVCLSAPLGEFPARSSVLVRLASAPDTFSELRAGLSAVFRGNEARLRVDN